MRGKEVFGHSRKTKNDKKLLIGQQLQYDNKTNWHKKWVV